MTPRGRLAISIALGFFSAHALGQGNIDQFLSAAEKGDVKSIQAAIAAGVDVNAADPAGYTALMKAANGGKLEAVRALLKAGAKVNTKSRQGYTPLMVTVASGSVAVAKLLLDNGADPSAMTPNGMTALDGAKRTGNLPLIQLLSKVTAPTDSAQAAPPPPPPPKTAISKQQVDAKTEQAAQAFKAGEYVKATALFQEVAAINPQDALVWHFLGQSLTKTNDVMGARRAFAKVLEIQPDGQLAGRTRDMLAKLPEPDLFTFKLGDGLTLGDWMPLAEKRARTAQQADVLDEADDYLGRFGPVPQLQRFRDSLVKEQEAQRDQAINEYISSARVHDATSAQAALPKLHELRQQNPHNLKLMKVEAKACHLTSDFSCAVAAYSAWLTAAPGNQAGRSKIAEGLLLAKSQQPIEIKSSVQELPAEINEKTRQLLEDSDVYNEWPNVGKMKLHVRNKSVWRDSEPTHKSKTSGSKRIEAIGSGIYKVLNHEATLDSDGMWTTDARGYGALGGLIFLSFASYSNRGAVDNHGKWERKPDFVGKYDEVRNANITSLSGTLFPLGSGKALIIKSEISISSGPVTTLSTASTCTSGAKVPANSLHPNLSGDAYQVQCKIEITNKGIVVRQIKNDYLIESIGLFASGIGAASRLQVDKDVTVESYFFPIKEGALVRTEYPSQYWTETSYDFLDIGFGSD